MKGFVIFINMILLLCGFAGTAIFLCSCNGSGPDQQKVTFTDSLQQKSVADDSIITELPVSIQQEIVMKNGKSIKDSVVAKQTDSGPRKTKSRFAQYTSFGSTKVNLDEGKKILCFFAPGCDHCMEAAKSIESLSKTSEIPEVYILFMKEELDKIPQFFNDCSCIFPYSIIEIPVFWDLFGMNSDTPGVFYLWNGNIIKSYQGTGADKFDPEDFKRLCGAQ